MTMLSAPIYRLKRRAKLLARQEKIALNEALDRIAREEGFAEWGLLSSRSTDLAPKALLPRLTDGDLMLLGARPGQGKTLLGLQLLLDAADEGRRAVFFTLEYSEHETQQRIRSLAKGNRQLDNRLEIVSSDDICAGSIGRHLAGSPRGTVAVIDYLQILDQRRTKPALADQLCALRTFARENGTILAFIAQIDRSFDPKRVSVPEFRDIRLPNPIELGVFSKACFLHDGAVRHQVLA